MVHEETTGFDRSRTLPEWVFVPNPPVIDVHRYVQRGPFYPDFSRFTFQFTIRRQSAYYLWKIFLPLLLIVAASWTVFWIDDLGINIGTAFTMMLTVVAFNFAIADTLPRVPYLTFMDAVLLASYISVFLSIIVLMVAHRFRAAGNQSASDRTKRVSRYAFPGGLAVVVGALVTIFLR